MYMGQVYEEGGEYMFRGALAGSLPRQGGQPQPASRRVGHSLWLSVGCHVLVCHGADA